MPAFLIGLFGYISSDLIIRLLSSIGVSLGVGLFIRSAMNDYINRALSELNGASHTLLSFAGLLRLDDCLSIMIGGIVFVATWKSMKLSFFRK